MKTKTIKVDYLARVEGEGGVYVKVRDNKVVDVKLKIFEPPRFFEAFLRGRNFAEARGYHCQNLRHLPHRLPDERRTRDGRRIRRSRSTGNCGHCGGSFIVANGSRVTPSTFTCCTRPIFSAIRMRSRWPRTMPASSNAACN